MRSQRPRSVEDAKAGACSPRGAVHTRNTVRPHARTWHRWQIRWKLGDREQLQALPRRPALLRSLCGRRSGGARAAQRYLSAVHRPEHTAARGGGPAGREAGQPARLDGPRLRHARRPDVRGGEGRVRALADRRRAAAARAQRGPPALSDGAALVRRALQPRVGSGRGVSARAGGLRRRRGVGGPLLRAPVRDGAAPPGGGRIRALRAVGEAHAGALRRGSAGPGRAGAGGGDARSAGDGAGDGGGDGGGPRPQRGGEGARGVADAGGNPGPRASRGRAARAGGEGSRDTGPGRGGAERAGGGAGRREGTRGGGAARPGAEAGAGPGDRGADGAGAGGGAVQGALRRGAAGPGARAGAGRSAHPGGARGARARREAGRCALAGRA